MTFMKSIVERWRWGASGQELARELEELRSDYDRLTSERAAERAALKRDSDGDGEFDAVFESAWRAHRDELREFFHDAYESDLRFELDFAELEEQTLVVQRRFFGGLHEFVLNAAERKKKRRSSSAGTAPARCVTSVSAKES